MAQPVFNGWAQDAYTTLQTIDGSHDVGPIDLANKWPPYSSPEISYPPSAFANPSLLTASSIDRFGQITPPDELSPAVAAEGSLAKVALQAERLQPDAAWQQPSPLTDYSLTRPHEEGTESHQPQDSGSSTKRRRKASQVAADSATSTIPSQPGTASPAPNPQPPKRKRGRPKAQPQDQSSLTAEGYPFPVSSARESHLEKNRVAAHKCRQRRKEYIANLENRSRDLSTNNRVLKESVATLRDEVLSLKNILLEHAGCGCWAIDEYLKKSAGNLLGMPNVFMNSLPQDAPFAPEPSLKTEPEQDQAANRSSSLDSVMTMDEQQDEHYRALDLIENFDEDENDGGAGA
ncbi:hypothetical protein M011DRAFT_137593 [Sporormia fimetaria CBS 119925]|uniref:BZIP domain-containing protein n=1 Tax=Sporormia fimetaria CBS 119925 TaxID=1340428 RepID=A0A6A6V7K3_9PLEO|nr:hypothetical protein M011DRAFT_137593 [Sporormia fimetaria CBS 119925]